MGAFATCSLFLNKGTSPCPLPHLRGSPLQSDHASPPDSLFVMHFWRVTAHTSCSRPTGATGVRGTHLAAAEADRLRRTRDPGSARCVPRTPVAPVGREQEV